MKIFSKLWVLIIIEFMNCFVWNHLYFEKLQKTKTKKTFLGCPQELDHRFICIVLSNVHSLLNFNVPFKLIRRRFEVVSWCLEWECCIFFKRLIHSNLPILYFGFNAQIWLLGICVWFWLFSHMRHLLTFSVEIVEYYKVNFILIERDSHLVFMISCS